MHQGTASYALIAVLVIYLIAALFSILLQKRTVLANIATNSLSIFSSALGLYISIGILLKQIQGPVNFSFQSDYIPFAFSFHLDSLSAFFMMIISLLSMVVSLYSVGYNRHYFNKYNTGVLGFIYNIFIASMIGVVTSGHVFFFLLTWELMSLASYFLVTYENNSSESLKAGTIYIIMTHIGTAFITAAFILIYKHTGSAEITAAALSSIPDKTKTLIFIFLMIGFGTKAGVIPFHIWLPYAHPSAPSSVSALMSGVMIKTAIYGMIRFIPSLLIHDSVWWGVVVISLGALSAFLGIAYALMENNIKRLLAYSSIENIGIILICFGLSLTAAARGDSLMAAVALAGALLHTFNHSLYKGLLFMGAGAIHLSTGTKSLEKLGGLIKRMPATALFFLVGAMSVSALPPFNGFIGEWLALQSLFQNMAAAGNFVKIVLMLVTAVVAMAGGLAVYCFVKAFGSAFLALPRTPEAENAKEAAPSMVTSMGLLAAACTAAGIFPGIILRLANSTVYDITGKELLAAYSGIGSLLLQPLKVEKSSFLTSGFAAVMLLISLLLVLIVFKVTKNNRSRIYNTWDCGYVKLGPRMEYSATGFSKPMKIVLRGIFRPGRQLKVEGGASPYFIKSAKYEVTSQPVFEKYIYDPVTRFIFNFARRARLQIQTGSIHAYLSYIFVAIVTMLIYYAFS